MIRGGHSDAARVSSFGAKMKAWFGEPKPLLWSHQCGSWVELDVAVCLVVKNELLKTLFN